MRIIKVCHVTSVHKSNDIRIFEKECSSLAKIETCRIFIVAKGDSYKKNNVSIVGVGEAPKSRIVRMLFFSKQIMKSALNIDADIYHLHDPELLRFVPYLKKLGKYVIFDSHENITDSILDKEYIPFPLRRVISGLYGKYAERIMKNCDALISVTPHIVEKLKLINPNTYMVTNYPLVNSEHGRKRKTKKYNSIIFAGGITPQWSHEMVLEALNNITGVCYDLYGPVDEEYCKQLKRLPGWGKTNYHGIVSFSEVQEALLHAGMSVILLQPSNNTAGKTGTLGNTKLFESMYAGIPVICTDFDLWKKIISEAECGICINPNSKNELESAIKFIMEHSDQAERMGLNGTIAVKTKYNWKTQEIILYHAYDRLIKMIINNND